MQNPEALAWYRFAQMDFTAAGTLNEYARPKPLEIICYHAQQCVEKMLKGFLIANDIDAPKKHDLPFLCDLCVETDNRFGELSDICEFLTIFGVQPRYPNEIEVLDEDTKRALRDAQTVIGFFRKHNIVTELEKPGSP
jgi:HEPN domain-containing protein